MVTILPLCACGCGERVKKPHHTWLTGHQNKMEHNAQKISASISKLYLDPTYKERVSKETKKAMRRPETREKLLTALKNNVWYNVNRNEKIRKAMIILWTNSEYRAKTTNDIRRTTQSKEAKARNSLAIFNSWKNPETRERYLKKKKTKEFKEKLSIKMKEVWESFSLDKKRQIIHKILSSSNKCPNKTEARLEKILSPLGFEFTGDRPLQKTTKCPDFTHKKHKLLIEYDGFLGHNTCLPWIPENQHIIDEERNHEYRCLGYRILCLHPDDLQGGHKHILNIVLEWMNG